MRILRSPDYRRMPWKNGGGVTTEIAVFPEGAGLGDFGWRVSMATVASDGPFSLFPGIERSLSLIEGEGMELSIGDAAPVLLTRASAPLDFPADVATTARLTAGPIVDLNVMTRRGAFRHRVERLGPEGEGRIAAEGETALLLALEPVRVEAGSVSAELGRLDAAVLEGEATWRVDAAAEALLIRIRGQIMPD